MTMQYRTEYLSRPPVIDLILGDLQYIHRTLLHQASHYPFVGNTTVALSFPLEFMLIVKRYESMATYMKRDVFQPDNSRCPIFQDYLRDLQHSVAAFPLLLKPMQDKLSAAALAGKLEEVKLDYASVIMHCTLTLLGLSEWHYRFLAASGNRERLEETQNDH